MSAISSTMSQPTLFAGKDRTQRMPAHSHTCAMWTKTAAIVSILLIGTGVATPVSSFALILSLILLALLAILISLILSGLTGLVGLVGLTEELIPGTTKGA